MSFATPVRLLGTEAIDEVVDVLCEAFASYPVMRFVLGGERADADDARLRDLIHFFVMARHLREEPIFGVVEGGRAAAVALASNPASGVSPPRLSEMREALWSTLGPEARARYEAFGRATSNFTVAEPHLHLNMVGVRRRHQGSGLGRRLIDAVQDRSRTLPDSRGVTLSTEDPGNVPFYEHLGFRLTGHASVGDGLQTWGFFRPDA